jgi:hypothetical protein
LYYLFYYFNHKRTNINCKLRDYSIAKCGMSFWFLREFIDEVSDNNNDAKYSSCLSSNLLQIQLSLPPDLYLNY